MKLREFVTYLAKELEKHPDAVICLADKIGSLPISETLVVTGQTASGERQHLILLCTTEGAEAFHKLSNMEKCAFGGKTFAAVSADAVPETHFHA